MAGLDDWSFLSERGRVAGLLRAADWSRSPLGPPGGWPDLLRSTLATILTSPQPMFLCWGPELTFLYNDAHEAILGPKAEGPPGRPLPEAWPDIWDGIAPSVERAHAGQGSSYEDVPRAGLRHGVPEDTWWTFSCIPLRDARGTVQGMLGVAIETSARPVAERRGRALRERLVLTSDEAPGFVAILVEGAEHRVAPLNPAYERLVGQGAALGLAPRPSSAPGGRRLGVVAQPASDAGDRVVEGHGVAEAQEVLHASEARFHTLLEAMDDAVVILEREPENGGAPRDYRYAMLNRAARATFGLVGAVGRSTRELRPGAEEEWYGLFDEVLDGGGPRRVERRSASLERTFEVYLARVGGPGRPQLLTVTRDVTERRRAEDALRRAKVALERRVTRRTAELRLLVNIVETTDAFVQVMGQGFRWLGINRAAADECARAYGVRPRVGDGLLELLGERTGDLEALRAAWARALGGEAFTLVAELGDPGADRRTYEMKFDALRDRQGGVTAAFQIATDVTHRARAEARLAEAEAQLRQSQKMEAIGQLTGGVAHDFNNLLTPIVGALDVLQRRALGGPREHRLIEGAAQAAERARVLVSRLLAFARRQPLEVGPVDLAPLVEGLRHLVASTAGPQVRVGVHVGSDLPPAVADANQLEMAILNLAANARDAMPGGGALTVSAAREEVGPGHPQGLPPGTFLRLWVEDTGHGMDEATRARAVEPFFSTKGAGKGSGLGLSMVHGLALQLGGTLGLESEPGQGTRVTLWLPATRRAAPRPRRAAQPPTPLLGAALLVDDEPLVRDATADMLAELGYRVTPASSADEALRLVEAGLAPDLLVTDHLMPGMTGTDLALRLRGMRPGLSVLIVSGFADASGLSPDLPRLAKPFRRDDLAASLARLRQA